MFTVILRVEPEFVFLSEKEEKRRLYLNRDKPMRSPQLKLLN